MRANVVQCVWACQQWTGLSLSGMAVQLLVNAGYSSDAAFSLDIIVKAMNIVGCIIEFGIINYVPRRKLLLTGMVTLFIDLLLMGAVGCVPGTHGEGHKNYAALKAIAAFVIMINLWFHITVGPVSESPLLYLHDDCR